MRHIIDGNWKHAAALRLPVADVVLCQDCPFPKLLRCLKAEDCGAGETRDVCGRKAEDSNVEFMRIMGYWDKEEMENCS